MSMRKSCYWIFWLFFSFISINQASEIENWSDAYFLPSNHRLKSKLDYIFSEENVLENSRTFKEAGFIILHKQSSKMRVAKHPLLAGYLVKAYLDEKSPNQGFQWLLDRCKGAENVRNLIQEKGLRYFTVPDKWIYVIPGRSFDSSDKQVAVLVVKDMNLVTHKESILAWKKATTKELDELYIILSHGFASCYLPHNISYTKKGKFACIDTAYPQRVHSYFSVEKYFSPEMQIYWNQLVLSDGVL